MPRVVSVVFRNGGKVYTFDAGELELAPGDQVVVDTARGLHFGRVVAPPREDASPQGKKQTLRRVRRAATAADLDTVAANAANELEAVRACRELVSQLGIEMKVVGATQSFDGGKLTVSFFAEERVDFRELAGKLNDRLKRRVELKQVSARDEARMVGGYGPCGRGLCCATFAGDQDPVSIRMAKDQNLPLNPTKISGCCGRLMCCLKYEHDVYVSFRRRAPKRGATVSTPDGRGRVTELLPPADSVSVDLGEGRVVTYKLVELELGETEAGDG